MSKLILLNKIHIYNHDRKAGTENSKYFSEKGYWLDEITAQPLVLNR